MPTVPITDEELQRTAEVYQECLNSGFKQAGYPSALNEAGKRLGVSESTIRRRLRILDETPISSHPRPPIVESKIELPVFPDDNLSFDEIVNHQEKRFVVRQASHKAHTWFKVKVKDTKPIGILWFGDPHLDDNGCNWTLLKKHIAICKNTPGMWGANIGDTTNNWAGRLVRLYANQDTSLKTAQTLAAGFMLEGPPWLIWLLGNHDQFGDGAGVLAQMAKRHGTQQIVCHDWEARFILTFPNGAEFRIHAAHDMKGTSQWNPLHGPMKAGKLGPDTNLLVCGDKHNWGIFRYENADRGITQTALRVRGYKFLDDHTRHLGITEQEGGCSLLTVFDPIRPGVVQAFDDIEQGAEYLTWLRSK